MNRTAHGCEFEVGRLRRELLTLADVSATKQGFSLRAPRTQVVRRAPPVEEQHAAVLAFLADGEAWSSPPWRLRLAPARALQRRSRSLRQQARCSRSVAGEHVVG